MLGDWRTASLPTLAGDATLGGRVHQAYTANNTFVQRQGTQPGVNLEKLGTFIRSGTRYIHGLFLTATGVICNRGTAAGSGGWDTCLRAPASLDDITCKKGVTQA